VSDVWILNASPVILFARINRLDLIGQLAARVVVPDAVISEIRAGEADDPSSRVALDFVEPCHAADLRVPDNIAPWDLGPGETQVIAQAIHASAWAVLDDLAARRCAATHKIPVIGSLGIILRAKRKGIIENAAPWIMKLKFAGMYLDETLIQKVLTEFGE